MKGLSIKNISLFAGAGILATAGILFATSKLIGGSKDEDSFSIGNPSDFKHISGSGMDGNSKANM